MSADPIYRNDSKSIHKLFLPADGTNWLTIVDNTLGTMAKRVEALNAVSDDPNANNIQFARYDGTTYYPIGMVPIPALAGSNGTVPRVNTLGAPAPTTGDVYIGTLAPDGIRVVEVGAGGSLVAKAVTQVAANKSMCLSGWYVQFEP